LINKVIYLAIPALLLGAASARADIYEFSYVGINNPSVSGSGTFTTGTPWADGYAPITSISGTAEGYAITGLVAGTADPGNVLSCCGYNYDNAFLPNSPNPFSASGGPLITVAGGIGPTGSPIDPVNLFGDGNGHTYEFSYGEDYYSGSGPSWGGTQVDFTVSDVTETHADGVTPEPSFYGTVVLCIGGMLFVAVRRRRTTQSTIA
jgi:hypothetical protein